MDGKSVTVGPRSWPSDSSQTAPSTPTHDGEPTAEATTATTPWPSDFGCAERLESVHVAVRDGTRLALDVYVPAGSDRALERPVIMIFTPYYRRFADAPDSPAPAIPGGIRADVEFFCAHGYGVVVVDIRGTGASFGSRLAFRSPQERDDCVDVIDWVIAQPWSDGRIGAIGWSYSGAAADFLATTGHPAVKAVVPGFAVWDTYTDMLYPGGMLSRTLTDDYGPMIRSLDVDDRAAVATYALFADMPLSGPAPVDSDSDLRLRDEAVTEHQANFDMGDHIREVWCRDAPLSLGSAQTATSLSPGTFADQTRPDTAVFGG